MQVTSAGLGYAMAVNAVGLSRLKIVAVMGTVPTVCSARSNQLGHGGTNVQSWEPRIRSAQRIPSVRLAHFAGIHPKKRPNKLWIHQNKLHQNSAFHITLKVIRLKLAGKAHLLQRTQQILWSHHMKNLSSMASIVTMVLHFHFVMSLLTRNALWSTKSFLMRKWLGLPMHAIHRTIRSSAFSNTTSLNMTVQIW